MKRSSLALVLVCLLGIPLGIGAFTFVYARGLSYLSPDPRACVNCHVMNAQYDGWLKSGHRHTATCVECHLPHRGIGKWLAKADHGFRHSAAFTLQNFKEPIEITPRDREIVRVNCRRCHEALVGVSDADLEAARALHRKAQWRLDFVAAENSMGFHAPQEISRILAESIDFARQAQLRVEQRERPK